MALKKPDIYEHNNPLNAIADSNFVRGGTRSAVASLSDLYALGSAPNDRVDQLKQHSTRVYVSGENKFYLLVDIENRNNANGWQMENFYDSSNPNNYITGINDIVYTTGNQNISGHKIFFDDLKTKLPVNFNFF